MVNIYDAFCTEREREIVICYNEREFAGGRIIILFFKKMCFLCSQIIKRKINTVDKTRVCVSQTIFLCKFVQSRTFLLPGDLSSSGRLRASSMVFPFVFPF